MTLGERCDEIVRLIDETLGNVAADDLSAPDPLHGPPFEGDLSEVGSSGLLRFLNGRPLLDEGRLDTRAPLAG